MIGFLLAITAMQFTTACLGSVDAITAVFAGLNGLLLLWLHFRAGGTLPWSPTGHKNGDPPPT